VWVDAFKFDGNDKSLYYKIDAGCRPPGGGHVNQKWSRWAPLLFSFIFSFLSLFS